jgi:glycosyltransferase involved in cell wall biosynthesis
MIHDAVAMLHAAFVRRVDCMLVLGYSGAWMLPVVRWLRPSLRTVTNIDGMEWRRDKFGRVARATLRVLEWFACRFSHAVIADNEALVPLVRNIHGVEPVVIAYGGDHTLVEARPCEIEPGYLLAIARVEPENNCGLILEAGVKAGARLVFVGNWDANTYGRELKARYAGAAGLTLIDSVYDLARLAQLRQGARAYLHGHSVGGTNPSLVEALFHSGRVLAFDCAFNRATLDGGGAYFKDVDSLVGLLADPSAGRLSAAQLSVLRTRYRWERVIEAYSALLVVQSGYNSASASAGATESLADKDG